MAGREIAFKDLRSRCSFYGAKKHKLFVLQIGSRYAVFFHLIRYLMPHSGYLFVERKEPGKMPHSGYLLCSLKDVTLCGNF
jgi:hypothetical protein